jgi:hypothetical protein
MRFFLLFISVLFLAGAAEGASPDIPKRKSGLWEIKVTSSQGKGAQSMGPMTMQQCVDQKSDDLMKNDPSGKQQVSCSKNVIRREGDKIVSESVCKVNGSAATTRAVITGNFDSAYKVDVKSTYDPPLAGTKEASTTMDAKWLGVCKAGQKPGDVSMPGMPNMDDLMKKMQKSK